MPIFPSGAPGPTGPAGPVGPAGPSGGALTVTAVKTGDYTANIDQLVRCDPTAAGFVVNLPAIAAGNGGHQMIIKNVSSSANVIAVTPNGTDTIEGGAVYNIAGGLRAIECVSDGVGNWMVI